MRVSTGLSEFDRVLGGGIVHGGVALLSGDPGIGKSTVLLQTAAKVSTTEPVLYITGEESLQQVSARAKRLGLNADGIHALAETQVESIQAEIERIKPRLVVVDSIQTLYTGRVDSAPGSVTQVRESTALLIQQAKQTQTAMLLVGHVTKDGNVAGPKVLEHMVDTVIQFEGDTQTPYRLMRAIKNRFGAANELGAFEMDENGLTSVDNASAMFLNEDYAGTIGSAICVVQEGPRPILVEIQALLDPMQGNNPKRLGIGVDTNRFAMIMAVINKHLKHPVGNMDAFVSAVGGIRAAEPGCDLPILLALCSSFLETPTPHGMCAFGEMSLTGEIRPVQMAVTRIQEAAKLGFTKILVPERNLKGKLPAMPNGVELVGVKNLAQALRQTEKWS